MAKLKKIWQWVKRQWKKIVAVIIGGGIVYAAGMPSVEPAPTQCYWLYISLDKARAEVRGTSPDYGDVVEMTPCRQHEVKQDEFDQFRLRYKIIKAYLTDEQVESLGTSSDEVYRLKKIDLKNLSTKDYYESQDIQNAMESTTLDK